VRACFIVVFLIISLNQRFAFPESTTTLQSASRHMLVFRGVVRMMTQFFLIVNDIELVEYISLLINLLLHLNSTLNHGMHGLNRLLVKSYLLMSNVIHQQGVAS
jgi:hypothetical protein